MLCRPFCSHCPVHWTKNPETGVVCRQLFFELIENVIAFWWKLNQLVDFMVDVHMHGIPHQLVILDGITHCRIQGMVITMCIKCPGLHIENLCCDIVSMPSHIGSNIITLPSASLPLQVYKLGRLSELAWWCQQTFQLSGKDRQIPRGLKGQSPPKRNMQITSCSRFDTSVHSSAIMVKTSAVLNLLAMQCKMVIDIISSISFWIHG